MEAVATLANARVITVANRAEGGRATPYRPESVAVRPPLCDGSLRSRQHLDAGVDGIDVPDRPPQPGRADPPRSSRRCHSRTRWYWRCRWFRRRTVCWLDIPDRQYGSAAVTWSAVGTFPEHPHQSLNPPGRPRTAGGGVIQMQPSGTSLIQPLAGSVPPTPALVATHSMLVSLLDRACRYGQSPADSI